MADKRLVDYIKKQMEAGYNHEQIKPVLLKQGWYETEVDEALKEAISSMVYSERAPSPERPKEMEFLEKLKKVLFSPTEFFENVRWEIDVRKPLKYLVILSLIQFLILVVNILLGLNGQFQSIGKGLSMPVQFIFLLVPVVFFLGNIIGSFISAAILHVFALLLGAKKGYSNTYKAVTYAMTPSLLISWLPFIGFISFFWTWFLEIKGLSKLHDISTGRAFLITILPILIAVILVVMLSFFIIGAMLGALFGSGLGSQLPPGNFSSHL